MRTSVATMMASAATLLVFSAASPAADRTDLTGRWSCDDGGVYFIRQIGNEVWWTGASREPKGKKKEFANIFHGRINGNVITGSWADDPAGETRGAGKLSLEIKGEGKKVELKKTMETGGFSGGIWTPHR